MGSFLIRRLRQLGRDQNGVVLIVFTLMLVPILLVVAVAVDFGQALVIRRELAAAVDAAALSLAQTPGLDDAAAQAKAESFIRAHYPDVAAGVLRRVTVSRGGSGIELSAIAELDSALLRVAGYGALSVSASSAVAMRQARLEVVLVLDNTGSMGDMVGGARKIDALEAAAETLVGILFGNAEVSAQVRVGLVPFANAVNIGTGFHGSAIMDETLPTALNTEQVVKETGDGYSHLLQAFARLGRSWAGCVRARGGGHDLTDATPTATDRNTLFTPYFAPDETDWTYANSYLIDPQSAGKYRRYAFYRDNPSWLGSGPGPNYNCPAAAIQPLTNVRATIIAALGNMRAQGSTVIPEGLAWGWRVISPGAPFTQGAAYDDPETVKAIVLLTDGRNDVGGGGNGHYKSYFSAYGFADNGHLGAVNGSTAEATLNAKLSTLCQTIKADKDGDPSDRDIVLYTIGFDIAPGSTIDSLMRGCASDGAKFFNTPSADTLRSAFQNIALGLTRLRLAR